MQKKYLGRDMGTDRLWGLLDLIVRREGQQMSEPYLNENGEHQIGNCTLVSIIKMLHNGWRISRIYFRATRRLNAVFLVERDCLVSTFWYYWGPGMDQPRYSDSSETPYHGSGWNTVYFVKE